MSIVDLFYKRGQNLQGGPFSSLMIDEIYHKYCEKYKECLSNRAGALREDGESDKAVKLFGDCDKWKTAALEYVGTYYPNEVDMARCRLDGIENA